MTDDGEKYAQERLQELLKERYYISKNSGCAYEDTGKLTPIEKHYIISFIAEEVRQNEETIKRATEKNNKK